MTYKFNPFTSNFDLDGGAQGPAGPTGPAGSGGVPYTGANATVNLNTQQIHSAKWTNTVDGVYQVISLDSSVFRRYTWTTSITGTLPQLFGGVILMDGWTHNVDIDASGNFLGCDDDGPCQCYAFDENGQQAVYTSATTTSGQVPGVDAPWVLQYDLVAGGIDTPIGQYLPKAGTFTTVMANTFLQGVNSELVNGVITATSITPNADNTTIYRVSGLATNLTINAPAITTSGYPGQKMEIWITSDSTGGHALTWTGFSIGDSITPPTTIAANKRIKVGIEYDDVNLSWDIIGVPGTY